MKKSSDHRDINQTRAIDLAKLLSLDVETDTWSEQDMASILRHQLNVKLVFDLSRMNASEVTRTELQTHIADHPQQTFSDLFFRPDPPLELLRLTKDFAKAARSDPDSPLPTEIATLLYYAAIVAARLRCNEKITELNDADLRKGIDWALEKPWLTSQLKGMLEEAKTRINA